MSFLIFCDDLLLNIFKFLMHNNDMIALRCCCQETKKITDVHGYIRTITFGMHTNFMNFLQLYDTSVNSIYKLTMEYMNDPIIWIPSKWPRNMIFTNCTMGNKLIDPPKSKTEILQIIDNWPSILQINWKKLPQLKELYINVSDFNFEGLEYCQQLTTICINLCNRNRKVPKWIGNFPNLKIIMLNLYTDDNYHFISPNLEVCLIPKNKSFTSISKIVPKNHLENDMYINLPDSKKSNFLPHRTEFYDNAGGLQIS